MPLSPANLLKVTVSYPDGSSPLEITAQANNFEIGNSRIDDTGLIKATGKLIFESRPKTALGESLDPRINFQRWAAGNRVDVELLDGATYRPHPRGALRILQRPDASVGWDAALELQVGCDLAYYDSQGESKYSTRKMFALWAGAIDSLDDPIPFAFKSTGFDNVSRADVVSALANAIGLPDLTDPLPGNFGYLRKIDGSIVQQMGLVALGAGYALWVDGSRAIRATKIDLNRAVDYSVNAIDLIDYKPAPGGDQPPADVQIVAPRSKKVSFTYTRWERSEPAEQTNPQGDNESIEVSGTEENPTVVTERSRGSIFPNAYPGSTTLIKDSSTTTENEYDGDDRLTQTTVTVQGLKGVVLPNLYELDETLFPATRTITDYEFADATLGDFVSVLRERVYEPRALVYPSETEDTDTLVLSRSNTTLWEPYKDGWKKVVTTCDYKSRQFETEAGYNSTEAPPQPTRRSPAQEETEDEVLGTEEYEANPGAPRKRFDAVFRTPITEDQEATDLAKLKGALIQGRVHPATWITPFRPEERTAYSPLTVWRITEATGTQVQYLSEGDTWVHSSDSMQRGAAGILLGSVTDGFVVPPYAVKARSALSQSVTMSVTATGTAVSGASNLAQSFTVTAEALEPIYGSSSLEQEFTTTVVGAGGFYGESSLSQSFTTTASATGQAVDGTSTLAQSFTTVASTTGTPVTGSSELAQPFTMAISAVIPVFGSSDLAQSFTVTAASTGTFVAGFSVLSHPFTITVQTTGTPVYGSSALNQPFTITAAADPSPNFGTSALNQAFTMSVVGSTPAPTWNSLNASDWQDMSSADWQSLG